MFPRILCTRETSKISSLIGLLVSGLNIPLPLLSYQEISRGGLDFRALSEFQVVISGQENPTHV